MTMSPSTRASKLQRRKRVSLEALEDRQLLATITVNLTADSTAVTGATLSLRQAIEISNGTLAVSSLSSQQRALVSGTVSGTNTIDFKIPTMDSGYDSATGVWTISPQSGLPAISTNAAIIDGYSQAGASKNTLAQGDNAKLTIAIDGGSAGTESGGLTLGAQGSQVLGLDVKHFAEGGVVIAAPGQVQVAGCFLGTDATGETVAPNGYGVFIENSSNMIGGPNVVDRNVISGNGKGGYGVYIPSQLINPMGVTPTGNVIENNYIGTDAMGTKGLGNQLIGVEDYGTGNTYGGTTAGSGNLISGNSGIGLDAHGSVTIAGNYVGTDVTGNVALGNGNGGDGITARATTGTAVSVTITNNVASGNAGGGILLSPGLAGQSTYYVANNMIGTNAAGTAALGNGDSGLALGGVENVTVSDNVISGNLDGVSVGSTSLDSEHNVFQGNLIGTDRTGTVNLGNTLEGILMGGAIGNLIGGTSPGQANVIAFNGQDGIDIRDTNMQDQVLGNSIFGNVGRGIDLFEVVNVPPLVSMTITPGAGSSGTLSGSFNGNPNQAYLIEVFSNPSAPAAGHEQGKTFVQDVKVTTGGSGKGSFSLSEPPGYYTADVTDQNGSTGEFASATQSQPLPASVTTVSSSANPSTAGKQVTFTTVVTAPGFQGTPTGLVTFTIDGQAQSPVALALVGGVDEAQFVTSTLTAGPHSVTAAYAGNLSVSPSSGSLPTQTVNGPNLQPTTTTLISSLDPSTVGKQVTFTAIVSPGTAAGAMTGTVTFTIDGTALVPVRVQAVKGKEEAVFSVSTLTQGTHKVSAKYNGDATFASSAVASPLVQTVAPPSSGPTSAPSDPPTVVYLFRYGIHMQQTVLVLKFSGALDATSAENVNNYVIIDPAGQRVSVDSAVYDPEAYTVTLKPATRINLHHNYHFTVIGTGQNGVSSVNKVLLDGADNGRSGSNYVTILNGDNVVWTPAERRKYCHPKHQTPAGALAHRFTGGRRA
jgi:hypothetical protein